MRKYLILSVAAMLALAACTKEQTIGEEQQDVIGFQVATYAQGTKADGNDAADGTAAAARPGEFPQDESFTAYAWHTSPKGETTTRFSNQRVAYNKKTNVWTTVGQTYYWMKTGYDDFVCYAPYQEGSPEVTPNSITWGKTEPYYQVKMDNKDLMYADKALKQTGVTAGSTVATPVPALFHHALAKLTFRVKANFLSADEGATTWEVKLLSAKLSGIRDQGTLALTLPANSTDGKWTLPTKTVTWKEGETEKSQEVHVWAEPAKPHVLDTLQLVGAAGMTLTTDPQDLYTDADGKAKSFYVLPQALGQSTQDLAMQRLDLELYITTTLPTEDEQGQRKTFGEHIKVGVDLKDVSTLKAWQMGQDIRYTIKIKPTANVDNPDSPEDVTVTFDPAVAGWEPAEASVNIQL